MLGLRPPILAQLLINAAIERRAALGIGTISMQHSSLFASSKVKSWDCLLRRKGVWASVVVVVVVVVVVAVLIQTCIETWFHPSMTTTIITRVMTIIVTAIN